MYSEFKDKHSDSDAIQLFTKEISLQFDDVQSTMEAYSFSDLAGIQTLMVILATYESEHQVKTWVSNYFEKSLGKRCRFEEARLFSSCRFEEARLFASSRRC